MIRPKRNGAAIPTVTGIDNGSPACQFSTWPTGCVPAMGRSLAGTRRLARGLLLWTSAVRGACRGRRRGRAPPTIYGAQSKPELTVITSGEAVRTMRFAPPAAAILAHLRSTGVNGRPNRPGTRARLRTFEADYARLFAHGSGTVPLTYHPVWSISEKPA